MAIFRVALIFSVVGFAASGPAFAASDGGLAPGWFVAAKGTHQYSAESLVEGTCGGRAAIVRSLTSEAGQGVSLMQRFRADQYRNRRVRLSATIDAKELTGWAGLWMRVDGPNKSTLAFDNMQNRPVLGTAHCVKASVVLDVPDIAQDIALGLVVNGKGSAELGNLSLEPVDATVPSTNLAPPPKAVELTLPPSQRETSPHSEPVDDVREGLVGRVWYSQHTITEFSSGSLRPWPGQLHRTSERSFSDRQGDYSSSLGPGNVIRVKGFDLGSGTFGMSGVFTTHREGNTNVYQGTWGGDTKYDAVIKVSRERVDMSWGFWQRHLVAAPRPQTAPGCVSFENRHGVAANYLSAPVDDALQICGSVFDLDAPPQQVLMSFLMTGFRRYDGW